MAAKKTSTENPQPGPQSFVQTAKATFAELDRWKQVGEEEARVVYEMTLRNELSGGTPVVREFEAEWRNWTGLRHALTVFNGTASLYSAMYGLGVGPGDEVICPSYTWICTISPAVFLGARPVFCESHPDRMLLDPEDVRRRITPKTKAIVAVHLWGWVCDMDALMEISEETGVPVIEDCSHAHGALHRGRPVGSIGRVGCWSLQGSKPVSAGEGGVLATNDTDLFERACLVGQVNRIVGMDLATERYKEYQPLGTGMKFRAHPLGIGIASVQLKKLPKVNEGRRRYVETIEAGLQSIPGVRPIPTVPGTTRGGYYGFPVHYIAEQLGGLSRDAFVEELRKEGIPATGDSGYPPLHTLPLFSKGFDVFTGNRGPLVKNGYHRGDLPVTEKMHDNLFLIPVMTDPVPGATDYVLDRIRRVADRHAV